MFVVCNHRRWWKGKGRVLLAMVAADCRRQMDADGKRKGLNTEQG
jgi:hypothetical protein